MKKVLVVGIGEAVADLVPHLGAEYLLIRPGTAPAGNDKDCYLDVEPKEYTRLYHTDKGLRHWCGPNWKGWDTDVVRENRLFGKLCTYLHLEKIAKAIDERLSSIRDDSLRESQVYLVLNLGDAFATGAMWDIAYWLEEKKSSSSNLKLYGLLIAPTTTTAEDEKAIAYATLKELAFYTDMPSFYKNHTQPAIDCHDKSPFAQCFLLKHEEAESLRGTLARWIRHQTNASLNQRTLRTHEPRHFSTFTAQKTLKPQEIREDDARVKSYHKQLTRAFVVALLIDTTESREKELEHKIESDSRHFRLRFGGLEEIVKLPSTEVLDSRNASFRQVFDELREIYTRRVAHLHEEQMRATETVNAEVERDFNWLIGRTIDRGARSISDVIKLKQRILDYLQGEFDERDNEYRNQRRKEEQLSEESRRQRNRWYYQFTQHLTPSTRLGVALFAGFLAIGLVGLLLFFGATLVALLVLAFASGGILWLWRTGRKTPQATLEDYRRVLFDLLEAQRNAILADLKRNYYLKLHERLQQHWYDADKRELEFRLLEDALTSEMIGEEETDDNRDKIQKLRESEDWNARLHEVMTRYWEIVLDTRQSSTSTTPTPGQSYTPEWRREKFSEAIKKVIDDHSLLYNYETEAERIHGLISQIGKTSATLCRDDHQPSQVLVVVHGWQRNAFEEAIDTLHGDKRAFDYILFADDGEKEIDVWFVYIDQAFSDIQSLESWKKAYRKETQGGKVLGWFHPTRVGIASPDIFYKNAYGSATRYGSLPIPMLFATLLARFAHEKVKAIDKEILTTHPYIDVDTLAALVSASEDRERVLETKDLRQLYKALSKKGNDLNGEEAKKVAYTLRESMTRGNNDREKFADWENWLFSRWYANVVDVDSVSLPDEWKKLFLPEWAMSEGT
jgi:hypothetical protein